jgi:hypothetical protein
LPLLLKSREESSGLWAQESHGRIVAERGDLGRGLFYNEKKSNIDNKCTNIKWIG